MFTKRETSRRLRVLACDILDAPVRTPRGGPPLENLHREWAKTLQSIALQLDGRTLADLSHERDAFEVFTLEDR